MKKLRILQVVPMMGKGGAERLVVDICNELLKREVDIRLLTFGKWSSFEHMSPELQWAIVPSRFVPSIFSKPITQIDAYRDYVNQFQPDIVHSHLFAAEIVTRHALSKDTKYFTHLHDNMRQFENFSLKTLSSKAGLAGFYEKKMMIEQYRKCDNHFIAISKHTMQYFERCLPRDLRKKIQLLHNAIHYDRFCRGSAVVPPNDFVQLVTTGSLVNKKNQIFLVDVVKILREKGLNAHLDMLGDGANRVLIEQRIQLLGLGEYIHLRGIVDPVQTYLHRAHIYVHAATYEPFGLVQIEAMAAGLPCVMLDGKGNRDIAENGKNGFLVEQVNAELFAEKIMALASNPELYRQMSVYAVSFAAKFDIKNYVDDLLRLYDSSLRGTE